MTDQITAYLLCAFAVWIFSFSHMLIMAKIFNGKVGLLSILGTFFDGLIWPVALLLFLLAAIFVKKESLSNNGKNRRVG